MKKFFLFTLTALALTFTACNGNPPSNPDELNIKEYVGSTWFLDSVNMGEFTTTHMCQPIFLLSENEIQLGNDVAPFKYENNRIFIRETAYDIVSLDEKGVIVEYKNEAGNTSTYYISALPTLDRDQQNAISEAALLGKYKMVIGSMTETKMDGSEETSYTVGGMITWITFKENNKMLYEDSSPNPDMEGIWELNVAEKKICFGTYSSLADMHEYGHPEDILVFNDDYLVTGSDYDYDPSMGMTHRHYESVFVRVK